MDVIKVEKTERTGKSESAAAEWPCALLCL